MSTTDPSHSDGRTRPETQVDLTPDQLELARRQALRAVAIDMRHAAAHLDELASTTWPHHTLPGDARATAQLVAESLGLVEALGWPAEAEKPKRRHVSDLHIPSRVCNALERAGLLWIDELEHYLDGPRPRRDGRHIDGIGLKGIEQIRFALELERAGGVEGAVKDLIDGSSAAEAA